MPGWADFNAGDIFYGFPDLEARGVKFAHDAHGAEVDPDTQDRRPTEAALAEIVAYPRPPLPRPARRAADRIADVCQYENSSNGDFLIDFHPAMRNVVLLGGGLGPRLQARPRGRPPRGAAGRSAEPRSSRASASPARASSTSARWFNAGAATRSGGIAVAGGRTSGTPGHPTSRFPPAGKAPSGHPIRPPRTVACNSIDQPVPGCIPASPARTGILIVPKADRRPGAVTVKAQGMRIDGSGHSLARHRRLRLDEDVVAGPRAGKGGQHCILEAIGLSKPSTQARGRVTLPRAQDISEVLNIAVEAEERASRNRPTACRPAG